MRNRILVLPRYADGAPYMACERAVHMCCLSIVDRTMREKRTPSLFPTVDRFPDTLFSFI